jgi:hypothetical protein
MFHYTPKAAGYFEVPVKFCLRTRRYIPKYTRLDREI